MVPTSDYLLGVAKTQLDNAFASVFASPRGTNRVKIIGGSHSAFTRSSALRNISAELGWMQSP
jgi:hypothetical protein